MPKKISEADEIGRDAHHDLAQELDVPGGFRAYCHESSPAMHMLHPNLEACMHDWLTHVSEAKAWAKKQHRKWPPRPACDVPKIWRIM